MAILAGDIKLVASAVMDDVDEGGGAPTSTIITDGASNSVFNDISEVDRAGGRVNLRKLFAHVQTSNTDTYLGGNVVVADTPDDPLVSVTIFKADSAFDERSDAQNRMESYLNKGPLWGGYLFENHVAGQRSIQIFQRPGSELPAVGHTYYLVYNEGASGEYYQYVRATKVESATRTFSYSTTSGYVDYEALVVTLSLSDALRYDFPGSASSRSYSADSTATRFRDTVVADAAKYYGATTTKSAVAVGDYDADVNSIFTKIVPSAQTETAMIDRSLAADVLPVVPTASGTITRLNTNAWFNPNASYYMPTGVVPGTLSLTIGSDTILDDSLGNVTYNSTTVGTIDYASGHIAFNSSCPSNGAYCTEVYRPATAVSMQSYSISRPVTQETRAYVWVFALSPIPAPGSLVVSYMAQGSWYSLTDKGDGTLAGSDAAYGVGTISYTTGTCSLTLGALPDIGSSVVLAWGTQQQYVYLSDTALSIRTPKIEFDFGTAMKPGTLTLTWTAGGVTKTATDNGSGVISGSGTGVIYYGNGTGYFTANPLPDSASISASYESLGGSELYGATTGGGVNWSATLPNAPIKPKSIYIELLTVNAYAASDLSVENSTSSIVPSVITDDGSGNLYLDGYGKLVGSSINYSTGALVLVLNVAASTKVPQYVKKTFFTVYSG